MSLKNDLSEMAQVALGSMVVYGSFCDSVGCNTFRNFNEYLFL